MGFIYTTASIEGIIKALEDDKLKNLNLHRQANGQEQEPVYFSKIQFRQTAWMYKHQRIAWGEERCIFLDLVNKELSYQLIKTGHDMASRIYTYETSYMLGIPNDDNRPTRIIHNGKNGETSVKVFADVENTQVVDSRGIRLTDAEMEELLPYCNAIDFEPYRGREMSMDDPGYRGYRDEISITFTGITDSYIPKIDLPMDYIYDKKHEWPRERLYEYIYEHFMERLLKAPRRN